MRVTSMEKFEITKEQLAKALKVPKINSITWKDSHFKINIQKGIKSINVYLRCEDVKGLLLLDFNIFDENISINKKGYIEYEREVEHIKQKFDLKDLHAAIKKALE